MSVDCELILQLSATPEQLTALGAALWRWCTRVSGGTGMYQFLDNQGLADLIAGRLPESNQTLTYADTRGVHFLVRDESQDRQAAIVSLRQAIPANGVEDILVEGTSWTSID